MFAWIYLANAIVDNYVVVRNQKQQGAMPEITAWIEILGKDAPVYFAEDYLTYKHGSDSVYASGYGNYNDACK